MTEIETAPAGNGIVSWLRKNVVLLVAFAAAAVTTCFIPPDQTWLSYFDYKTLTCLFCTLAVVTALRNIRFFTVLARGVVTRFRNLRLCVLALVCITFLGSMLIANDMALLTFLPLGFFVLDATGQQKSMAVTFILQNIAANLGGMLTPFGNPQNLYLYSRFDIPNADFFAVMAPPFAVSILLITLCCFLFIRPEPLTLSGEPIRLPARRTAVYLVLFALAIAIVFRGIPYYVGLIVIPVCLLFLDRKALAKVDYPLLFTFVFFFIFAGNMGRIEAVRGFFSGLLGSDPMLVSALSCQVISNVPSAILLSQFTTAWRPLLLGVNIGGTGTLIASLASLITFREYTRHNKGKALRYLGIFSAFNFSFLILLLLFERLIGM